MNVPFPMNFGLGVSLSVAENEKKNVWKWGTDFKSIHKSHCLFCKGFNPFLKISWKFLVGLLPEVEYLLNLYLMNKTTLDKTQLFKNSAITSPKAGCNKRMPSHR